MKIELTGNQINTLVSMNNYWEEISKREKVGELSRMELNQLFTVLNPIQVLLIVGEFAKQEQSPL